MEPTTTKSKVLEGKSASTIWKLENWKNHHKLLATEAYCDLKVDDIELRFFLQPYQKISHNYENRKDNIADFYSLWVKLLSHHQKLSFKITTKYLRTTENESHEILKDHFIYLKKTKYNSSCTTVVDPELIVSTVWNFYYESGHKCLSTDFTNYYLEVLDDLEISITTTLCSYVQQEESPTFGTRLTKELHGTTDQEKLFTDLLADPENSFADIVTMQMQDDVVLKGHRLILSRATPVFEAMLTTDFKETHTKTVEIPDVMSNVMEILLWYIHTGANTVSALKDTELLEKVIYAASKYQLIGLLEYCDSALTKQCNVKNVMTLLKVANKYNLSNAKLKLSKYAEVHSLEIVIIQLESM